MKKIAYISSLLLLMLAACSQEDEKLTNSIDFSSPYVITHDDPNDPVQHKIYQLYKEYTVPVFFKDTIEQKLVTYDYEGKPIYRYETIDLRWRFSSYQNSIAYQVEEIKEQEEQLKALDFVEYYLKMISPKMRPFCIYTVKTILYNKSTGPYLVGFRTLTLVGVNGMTVEADRKKLCLTMINSMALDRVKQNEQLVARFTNVSQKNNWYGLPWKGNPQKPGLSCSYFYTAYSWTLNPKLMYDGGEAQFLKDVRALLGAANYTVEKAYEIRENILKDIGQYGFICGSNNSGAMSSPDNATHDLEYFVGTMINIGDAKFKERYGASPLVMQKYNMLYDYLVNELGVNLN